MIRWCSYCQTFMGEREPLREYSITHGVCGPCSSNLLSDAPEIQLEKLRPLIKFFNEVQEIARRGEIKKIHSIIQRAQKLKIRPIDLAMGVIAPLLKILGQEYEQKKVTIAQEHLFTAFCEELLFEIYHVYRDKSDLRYSNDADVLLAVAEGNMHTLGVRIVELFLISEGIKTYCVYPGLPAHEMITLAQKIRPKIVGISTAPHQSKEDIEVQREKIEKALRKELPNSTPKILIGGEGYQSDLKNILELLRISEKSEQGHKRTST